MTKDEALKMAIEIFTKFKSDYFHMTFGERWEKLDKAIDLVKEALEQPAQEPVGFVVGSENYPDINIGHASITDNTLAVGTALYTHPHQWQGLTDDEYKEMFGIAMQGGVKAYDGIVKFARAIEAKLKEKNYD
jgi:hypothetical protein